MSRLQIKRCRLLLFRSVIRLHLILFGQTGQTLKRREVCECVSVGNGMIGFPRFSSFSGTACLRQFVVVLNDLVKHLMPTHTEKRYLQGLKKTVSVFLWIQYLFKDKIFLQQLAILYCFSPWWCIHTCTVHTYTWHCFSAQVLQVLLLYLLNSTNNCCCLLLNQIKCAGWWVASLTGM